MARALRSHHGIPVPGHGEGLHRGLKHVKLQTDAEETREVIATLPQQVYLRLVVNVLQGIKV
jgi:hypothetical protein